MLIRANLFINPLQMQPGMNIHQLTFNGTLKIMMGKVFITSHGKFLKYTILEG